MSTGVLPDIETSIKLELQTLTNYSVPLVITFLLQYSLNVASVFSVGRIGKAELAAVSLAGMTANITGYCLFQGTSTSLDTLCAQAYGRHDYRAVGLHFMRCTIFLMLLYIPICFIWVFLSHPFLLFIVDDLELVTLASQYLGVLAIGLPGFILFETLKRFLQAQNIFHASTYVILFAAPFNAFLNYYLVWGRFGLGFIGAPIAIVCTNYVMAILLTLYVIFVDGHQCWCGFSKELLINWSKMISLSVNGCVGVLSEWLAFEILTLSAARFGTISLASQSVIATICVLLYQVPFAISIAASTRVANYIGAASRKSTIIASSAAIILSLIVGCINALVLTLFKDRVVRLFTSDPDVIELSCKIIPLGALYQINDCLAAVTGGILRGQGRQKLAALCSLVSYYLVALPIGFWLAFGLGLKLFGLWIGLCIAIFTISLLQLQSVLNSDWEQIINESLEDALQETNVSSEVRSVISHGI
jgi:MATE family multidrug resistance protein